MHLNQKDLQKWGQQRVADAPRIAKKYRDQGAAIDKLLAERGCDCNPYVFMPDTPDGPNIARAEVSHSLGCPNG